MTEAEGGTVTYRGTVYPWHCDHMGHMNVMWYVGKFDEATWIFFAENGLAPAYLRESKRGMAAVEQRLRYLKELHAGDVVHITTRLLEAAPRKIRFEHRMINDVTGELAATSELTGVHLDTVARRATEFEDAVRAKLDARLAADTLISA
jgi:acyl-CoA thioester hydrolase